MPVFPFLKAKAATFDLAATYTACALSGAIK